MQPGNPPRRSTLSSTVVLALSWALIAAGAAQAAVRPAGVLSPRLDELAKPAVRSAPPAEQARKLSLAAEGPGSLLRDGNRVLVSVRFDGGAAEGVEKLRVAGARVVTVSPGYQTVTVAAKPDELRRLSGVPGVAGATEVLAPITAAATCPSGAVVSEGVHQLHAGEATGEARQAFGVDGSGVTVGVLSDSFDESAEAVTHQAEDVASGDLPGAANTCGQLTPVADLTKFEEPEEGEDEGRAMAQIVHDVAPASKLAFATAFTPDVFGFADNIRRLAEPVPGAEVIADDVSYFEEPFFQEGPVDSAIREVTESGIAYFSAAGNDNLLDSSGHDIASWEATEYRDSGDCPPAVQAIPEIHGTHCLDFNPGSEVDRTFGIKVAPGETLLVDLQWAEPWYGVGTDLDAFLLDASGGLIAESIEDNVGNSQMPFEFIPWENNSSTEKTVQLVVNRYSGASPRLKFGLLENGFGVTGTEYPRSAGTDVVGPTIFGHSGSADAISVAAVPFDDSAAPEEYSSRGPVTHYFGPVDGSEPAEQLVSPETLSKPDIAATDCGVTTFFAFQVGGKWRFCGTSAAAPHAAGVAALMLDAESASPAEIRSALQSSAVAVGGFGACAVGAGLVEAVGAIEDLIGSASSGEPDCFSPAPEVSVEEAREPGDWGSEGPPTEETDETETVATDGASTSPAPPEFRPRPSTSIRQHPSKLVRAQGRTAKVVFRFGAGEQGATFLCRVDGGSYRICPARFVRRFGIGEHVLRVKARDSAGNVDPTPALFRFRVMRRRGA